MSQHQTGAIIESGPCDWQIIQQGRGGLGRMELAGRWAHETEGRVEVRLVGEDTSVPVAAWLDWQAARTDAEGTWSATLRDIPAGGLYRLETRFNPAENPAGEWSVRGDMRHFLGVGDLWVIAGQSNSAGYGRGPIYDPPEWGVHVFRNSETWAPATQPMNESTDTKHICNRETANSGHSPYLHFGRLLKRRLGYPIGLVQTSLGGSPLQAWNPRESEQAVLFENMVHCVKLVGGNVRGVLWYQGESDTGTDENAGSYAERFIETVHAWRERLERPDLAVMTVQLNRVHGQQDADANRRWTQVREAQRQVPHRLDGVAVVPAIDLGLTDGIHTGPSGNLVLAERMAAAALGSVCDQPVAWRAPEPESARLDSTGRVIQLTFVNVTSRIENIDPTARPFRVEDEAGAVPLKGVAYAGSVVKLALEREVQGRAQVHGGYGADPERVPMDMERVLPILAFYGLPVD